MKGFLRLRDLENVTSQNIDVPKILKEAYNFKATGILRGIRFRKLFFKVYEDIKKLQNTDVSIVEYKKCAIKKPNHIEEITYAAMMRLQSLMSKQNEMDLSELIGEIIATSCYSANHKKDFNKNSNSYASFKQRILNQPIVEMFGIYNWIVKSTTKSNEDWQQRFFSVEVEDPDYEQAGGNRMSQFNVLNTIKKICQDFNRTDEQAWQMPFFMVQNNNYEAASKAYTQFQMSRLKEIKMRAERDRQNAY